MKINADILRRLSALNLPGDSLAGVLSILADIQADDDARQEKEIERRNSARHRTQRWRHKKRHGDVTDTSPRSHGDDHNPPDGFPHTPFLNPPEIPKPSVSADEVGPSQAELEKDLFRRGRQVCGKASGGLIASLLKAKSHDVSLARSVLELAATKHDPREYVAASLKGKSNGQHGSDTMDAFDRIIAGTSGEIAGDPPMRDVTPRGG